MMAPAQSTQRTLDHLLDGMAGPHGATPVAGVQLDSRRVQPGDLFLAVPGEVHDGRQFIEQAVANGASEPHTVL